MVRIAAAFVFSFLLAGCGGGYSRAGEFTGTVPPNATRLAGPVTLIAEEDRRVIGTLTLDGRPVPFSGSLDRDSFRTEADGVLVAGGLAPSGEFDLVANWGVDDRGTRADVQFFLRRRR